MSYCSDLTKERIMAVSYTHLVMSLIEQIDKRGVGPQHKSIIDRCTALVYPEAEKEGRAATLCLSLIHICRKNRNGKGG